MEYKYTGIILNKRDVGETDRIYIIYTREGGKIKSIAKGVRKAQAKLAASLENFTLADITIARSRGMGKITGSIIENSFTSLRTDVDALLDVFQAISFFEKFIDLESADAYIYELLKSYLEAMDSCSKAGLKDKYQMLRLGFFMKLLDLLGYKIEVGCCVVCGGSVSQQMPVFSPQQGGIVCNNCASGINGLIGIKTDAIKMMRLFLNNDMQSLVKIKAHSEICDSAQIAINDFMRWNIG